MSKQFNEHLSAERLQALLEGDLPPREQRLVEEHVAACARCSAELDGWSVLFEDLSELEPYGPRAGFGDRVMSAVHIPERLSLAARARAALGSVLASGRPAHVGTERLQDFVDGLLPARQVARVEAHVGECANCGRELRAWHSLVGQLSSLERFAPGDAFADNVMAEVLAPAAAPVAARVVVREPAWRRALGTARRFAPQTRRGWAALSGVAVTPAVTVGLVFYVVFSHPTLTPQALASFMMWKMGDLFSFGWNALLGAALGGVQSLGLGGLVETAMRDPLMIAGGALAYSVVSVLALRVLYKNLMGNRRYVRLSHS
jgi:anti-sigma factor RsiW